MRYHDTDVVLGDIPYPFGTADCDPTPEEIPHDDPRWPKTCHVCGTPFRDEDNWQHNVHRLYSGAPDGKLYTVRDMPPGSMYDATWWPKKGPDGICMHVVLPPAGGLADYWNVDGPSSNGPGWTRTGTIPLVTARPSIQTPRYHGFLTDGFLMEC
jgi:hypothetical protein